MHNKAVQKKDLMELQMYRFRLKRQISRLKMLYADGDLTKRKVTGISKGDTTYTREDLELAEKWRKFLQGYTECLRPATTQLSLF